MLNFVKKRALHNHWHFHYNNGTNDGNSTGEVNVKKKNISTNVVTVKETNSGFTIPVLKGLPLTTSLFHTIPIHESSIPLTTSNFPTIPVHESSIPLTTTMFQTMNAPTSKASNLPSNPSALIQDLPNSVSITIYSGIAILILATLTFVSFCFLKKIRIVLISKKKEEEYFDDVFVNNSIVAYTERIRETRSLNDV
ncbi:hypothetical protein HK099_008070 [Clydaea vesicula]|uniref:Uncharacterized protein n=1 Tax=Clydaea vesicula TaxID=447962 RepID=A0AAD5U541_9FUNG|nr:hypothetical protein HK099_008070 [Clydaea vesicula]